MKYEQGQYVWVRAEIVGIQGAGGGGTVLEFEVPGCGRMRGQLNQVAIKQEDRLSEVAVEAAEDLGLMDIPRHPSAEGIFGPIEEEPDET